MRKLRPVGERINEFDNLTIRTVATFNNLFPECPLEYEEYIPVSIGDYIGADRRRLDVGGQTLEHKMFRDTLYGMDRDIFYGTDKEEPLDEIYGHPV